MSGSRSGAGLELGDEPVEVGGGPGVQVGQGDRLALLGVGDQIDEPGGGQPGGRIGFELLVDQDQLEVPPLGAIQLGPHPVQVTLSLGLLDGPGQPVQLVDAVDDAVPGRWAPVAAVRVVNQSVTCMMSSLVRPGGM